MWRRGDRVRHDEFGPGIVRDKLVLGRTIVAFDARPRLTRTVHEGALRAEALGEGPTRENDAAYAALMRKANPRASAMRPVAKAPSATASSTKGPSTKGPSTTAFSSKGPTSARPQPDQRTSPVATTSPASNPRDKARVATFLHSASAGPRPRTEAPPIADPLGSVDAWQTLEALRLGVVPARGVREYTIARDVELANVDTLLRDGHGYRTIWGDYGAGKTHLLEASEQLALERGFAVARVTLDPTAHGLHHPLRLYRAIAEGVRTLDQAQPGIEHILDRLVDSAVHRQASEAPYSRFYSPYTFIASKGDALLTETFADYVRGEDVPLAKMNQCLTTLGWTGERLLALSDYRTYGRMYVHMVGTLAAWCKDAGLSGLALFFDEVERVDALRSEERELALEVFRHYAAVMMEPMDLAFDPESLYRGGHFVHRALPLRFREELPLVGMFALTPLADIVERYRSVTVNERSSLALTPLGPQSLGALVERVAALYGRAYPAALLADEVLTRVEALVARSLASGEDSLRNAVRATVFALDAARLGGLPALDSRDRAWAQAGLASRSIF